MLIELLTPPNQSMQISPKSVYQLYIMTKRHFSGTYDCIKYNWKIRVSDSAFANRRDKYFFDRLSKKYNLGELYRIFICNLIANPDAWVGEISGADALQFYRDQMGKIDRASYLYKEDLENLIYFCKNKDIKFSQLFECSKGQPIIFKLLQQEAINTETFILLDTVLKFTNTMDSSLADDIVWIEYRKRVNGYKNLLNINAEKAKSIMIETFKK